MQELWSCLLREARSAVTSAGRSACPAGILAADRRVEMVLELINAIDDCRRIVDDYLIRNGADVLVIDRILRLEVQLDCACEVSRRKLVECFLEDDLRVDYLAGLVLHENSAELYLTAG